MKNNELNGTLHVSKKARALLLAGTIALTTLSGCSTKEPVVVTPSPTPVATQRVIPTEKPIPDSVKLNGEKEVEETKKPATTKTPVESKEVVAVQTPAPVVSTPAPEAVPTATPAPVVNPNYPYNATIGISLNNGTFQFVQVETNREAGKDTIFVSKDTIKVCGVVVTNELLTVLNTDKSIKHWEFENCQIDTFSAWNSLIQSIYFQDSYIGTIGSCDFAYNMSVTLDGTSIGDPASLKNLRTCRSLTLNRIPESYLSSVKTMPSLRNLTLKNEALSDYRIVNETSIESLYMENCSVVWDTITSKKLSYLEAFNMDLGDLAFLYHSSVDALVLNGCSFTNVEVLNDTDVTSVRIDEFAQNRKNTTTDFDFDGFYDIYTLRLN